MLRNHVEIEGDAQGPSFSNPSNLCLPGLGTRHMSKSPSEYFNSKALSQTYGEWSKYKHSDELPRLQIHR